MKTITKTNVIDRVLTNPQRYKMTVVDSANAIYDLESQAIVGTEGTKINKALFDTIDANFTLIDARLASEIGTSSGTPDEKLVLGGLYLYPDDNKKGYKVKRYDGSLTEIPITATYVGGGKDPMTGEMIPSEIGTGTASSVLMAGGIQFVKQTNGNYKITRNVGTSFTALPIDADSVKGETALLASNLASVTSNDGSKLIKGGLYFVSATGGFTIKRWDGSTFTDMGLIANYASTAGSASTADKATNADYATKAGSATSASTADKATSADSASTATTASSATTATTATTANYVKRNSVSSFNVTGLYWLKVCYGSDMNYVGDFILYHVAGEYTQSQVVKMGDSSVWVDINNSGKVTVYKDGTAWSDAGYVSSARLVSFD